MDQRSGHVATLSKNLEMNIECSVLDNINMWLRSDFNSRLIENLDHGRDSKLNI